MQTFAIKLHLFAVQKRPLQLVMMKLAVCFTLMLLQGAISASPSVNKPSQSLDTFLRILLEEYKASFEEVKNEEAADQLELNEMAESDSTEIPALDDIVKLGHDVAPVAFHAYLSSSKCYGNDQTIVFNVNTVDDGSSYGYGFKVHSGTFTAPTTGLYAFTWTVAAEHGTWFYTQLIVNGVVKGIVMADADVGGRASGIHPATGFVLARVRRGQSVFIRFKKRHGCTIKSDYLTRSTFTGWLMHY